MLLEIYNIHQCWILLLGSCMDNALLGTKRPLGEKCKGKFFFFILNWIGSSANARPVGKNHPLEKIRFEPFAGVSTVGVQWQGLGQGLPPSCSRKFLWQVSMLSTDAQCVLYAAERRIHCTVDFRLTFRHHAVNHIVCWGMNQTSRPADIDKGNRLSNLVSFFRLQFYFFRSVAVRFWFENELNRRLSLTVLVDWWKQLSMMCSVKTREQNPLRRWPGVFD